MQRGRKSAAALTLVPKVAPVEIVERPRAPSDLTEEARREWDSVVATMSADWFPRETHALLAQYCRHVVTARRIAQLIEQAEQGSELSLDEYDKLTAMAGRESRAIAMLCTKLRLSQQSIYDQSRKKPKRAAKPWE